MEAPDKLYNMRHSAAHLLAMAVRSLFELPNEDVKLGIGPVIENGFYYDFELPRALTTDDLPVLEAKMHELIKEDIPFVQKPISGSDAEQRFSRQPYKLELIDELSNDELTVYQSGDFTDLCRGPHVAHSGEISPHFKLTSLAGAYWRGQEGNPMLQRVYGVLFATETELTDYLERLEEAKRRDHRKLGQELDLFTFSPLVGAGLPLFTPKGTMLRELLGQYLQTLQEPLGYERVWIPHIAKSDLYKTSGHWDKFKDDLFHVSGKSGETFVMKPMNCPHHNQIYASKPRSYRDLPIRYAEITTNYRDEQTGELHGLSRVRSLTQDDGHVYCRPEQVMDEIMAIYGMIKKIYTTFAMPLTIRLSLRDPEHPEKYLGNNEMWEQAENTLKQALEKMDEPSTIGLGEAAFYGPKLDYMATDAIGRQWQLATIQFDFNQPARFKLTYADTDGQEKQPIMIHRALLGSVERFLSVLIEHFAGDFPLWLAPNQVAVLPISDKFIDHAQSIIATLKQHKIRVVLDTSNESIGKKIRTAETQKYPLMLIVGQKEVETNTVSVRSRIKDMPAPEAPMMLDAFMQHFTFGLPGHEK